MTATSGIKGEYRLIVPAGVTVVADEGPEKTIIRGDSATGVSLSESPFGCGESAVRCVQLKGTGATIKVLHLQEGGPPAILDLAHSIMLVRWMEVLRRCAKLMLSDV
jgi:hypothetical protein